MMGSGFGIPGLGMILIWVLIIGLAVLLVRAVAGGSSGSGSAKSARQILDERFARGEIDQREYEERRHMFVLFPAEGEERARVLVFTDTTCPYCRKLHQEVPALRKAGVTIAYIPFPRGGKGSPGERALRSVWCAEDRPTAFDIAVGQANGKLGTGACPASAAVDAGYRLGLQVGVSGTPTIVLPSGAALPGYLNAQGLLARLGLGKVSIAH